MSGADDEFLQAVDGWRRCTSQLTWHTRQPRVARPRVSDSPHRHGGQRRRCGSHLPGLQHHLRRGNDATTDARGVLGRLLARLRIAFPKARFLVRLDGGFATPEILDFLDAEPHLQSAVTEIGPFTNNAG